MLNNESLLRTLERIRSREPQALDDFLQQVAPTLHRYGLRMCRNEEDAQDVAQESLIAAMRSAADYRGESSVSTWLYTIARSFCIKKRRRSKFAPKIQTPLHFVETNVLRTEATAHEKLHQGEFEATLANVLATMDSNQREVFILRDIEGLSAKEVGEVLGITEGVVKSRLHRARENVRQKMASWFEDDTAIRKEKIKPSVSCPRSPQISQLYSKFIEGELDGSFCDELKSHVADCPECKNRCDCLQRTLQLCGKSGSQAELSPDTLKKLRQNVAACLKT